MKSPVIILGAERSGTTLVYSLLSNHSAFYWFSQLDSLFPKFPRTITYFRYFYSKYSKQNYISKFGEISKSKGFNTPSECLPYWKNIFHFGSENDYQIEDDYFDHKYCSNSRKERILNDLNVRSSILSKERILIKQPGFSLKIRFFEALFENPKFIIVYRDLRDNLRSLVNAKEKSSELFWGIKIPGWKSLVNSSIVEQATRQISLCYEIIVNDLETLDNSKQRYIFVNYDDLVENPFKVTSDILTFCEENPEPIFDVSSSIYDEISGRRLEPLMGLTKDQEYLLEKTEIVIRNAKSKV